jgi:hypothetical protein
VLGVLLGAAAFAFVLATVLHVVLRRLARRATLPAELSRHSRRPMAVTVVLAALYAALHSFPNAGTWQRAVEHVLFLGLIGSVAWLVASLAFVVEDAAITRTGWTSRRSRATGWTSGTTGTRGGCAPRWSWSAGSPSR